MQSSHTIITPSNPDEKLLIALFMLLGLKGIGKGLIISSLAMTILFLYTLIAHAIFEIASSIHQLWMGSDSITRLILVVIAIYCVKRLFPYALSLHKKGVI